MSTSMLDAVVRFSIVLALMVSLGVEAQAQPGVPKQISYQGVIYDSTGIPVCDSIYSVDFTLYNALFGGAPLWQERHIVQTKGGLFGVILGATTPITFTTNQRLWLGMSVNGRPELAPRTFLTSVPYALRADSAVAADAANDLTPDAVRRLRAGLNAGSSDVSDIDIDGTIDSLTLLIRDDVVGADELEEVHDGPLGPFGSPATSAVLRIDAQGRVVAATEVPISGVAPAGAAGGDLTGTYPSPIIRDAAVSTLKIADDAVTTAKLADNAVTTPKITDNAITSIKIADNAVTSPKLADNAVTTTKIIDNAVTSAKIIDNAVTSTKILDNAVTSPKIADNAVTTSKIIDNAVTTSKIIDNAVTSSKIIDNAVTSSKIIDNAVTTPKIADNAITTVKIIDNAVTTRTVANGAITNEKIAVETITAASIRPGSITSDRMSPMPLLPGTYGSAVRIPRLSVDQAGRIMTIADEPIRFPFDSATAGALRGRYPNPDLADASITTSKLSDGSVSDAKLTSTGVAAGTYGSATQTGQFTVDEKGRITQATTINLAGIPPGGTAGGDLQGTYPNPAVAALQGRAIAATAPADNQVLAWSTATNSWMPATPSTAASTIGGIGVQTPMAPNDGDAVCYDAATNTWKACNPTANVRTLVLGEGDAIDVDALAAGTATLNDVAISNHAFFRLTNASAGSDLTGLTQGQNGRMIVVVNTSSQTITLYENDARSIDASRMILGAVSIGLDTNHAVTFIYSAALQRWVLVAKTS